MSRFKQTIKDTFVTYDVDLSKYQNVKRKVRKLHPKPSDELVMLVVNFQYHKQLAVSLHKNYFTGKGVSYIKVKTAIDTLITDGYIVKIRPRWHDPSGKGRTTTYERTALFRSTFVFRGLPKRIRVVMKWSNGNGHLEKSDRLLERCSNDRREEKELHTGIQA